MAGTLFVVATPIGNLEDISARALRVLKEVALIAAEDTRHTARLLTRYAIQTPTTSFHHHTEPAKVAGILARLAGGDDVAVVTDAGTPTVSDPGVRLIRAAVDAGIRVEPVPGPSAALTALAVSGFGDGTFTFLGFPPTRSNDRARWFESVRTAARTVIFFEAPHRIASTLGALQQRVGDVQVVLGRELTKAHEELVRGPISAVLSGLAEPKGEFTVVVDIGQKTEFAAVEVPSDADLAAAVGRMAKSGGFTRRRALSEVARRYSMTVNEVYAAVERARRSVE